MSENEKKQQAEDLEKTEKQELTDDDLDQVAGGTPGGGDWTLTKPKGGGKK